VGLFPHCTKPSASFQIRKKALEKKMAKLIISEHLSFRRKTSLRCNRTHQLKLWWVEKTFCSTSLCPKTTFKNPTSKMKAHNNSIAEFALEK
jgi:hypothetical protein